MTENIIRLERAIVKFCDGLTVDGYRLPNGEFRVGITGASTVLGFAKSWLSQVHTRQGKALKALQGLGFEGFTLEGVVSRDDISGSSKVKTISLNDFALLILYGATQKKKEAIALQLALTKMSLMDFFMEAFGEEPLTMKEKHKLFYKDYGKTINWFEEDLHDFNVIEEQLKFLGAI